MSPITIEKMEKYLAGIVPPVCESDEHRRRLRGKVLGQLAGSGSRDSSRRAWKVAMLVIGLLGAGALLAQVAVQVHRYLFQGRTQDGSYLFETKPEIVYDGTGAGAAGGVQGVKVGRNRIVTIDPEEPGVGRPEDMQKDLEEIDSLREQGARELKGVIETEVNGYALGRVFQYQYLLADGRLKVMNEGGSDLKVEASPAQIEKDQQEIAKLRQQGHREVTSVIDAEVGGRIDRTLLCRYVLSDGREVTVGEGDPSPGSSVTGLLPSQYDELFRLGKLKAGTLLGYVQKQLFGRNFTFTRYSYRLGDGTVVIVSEGQPTGWKRQLTQGDWSELRNLTKSGKGELVSNYYQEVSGKLFSFEKRRYILSDGTEVIQSRGVLKPDN